MFKRNKESISSKEKHKSKDIDLPENYKDLTVEQKREILEDFNSKFKYLPDFAIAPDKKDMWLIAGMYFILFYSIALKPLKPWLMLHPLVYSIVGSGYTSAIISGAFVYDGKGSFFVFWAIGTIFAMKFIPYYWYMGKKWGIDIMNTNLIFLPRVRKWLNTIKEKKSSKKSIFYTFLLSMLAFLPGKISSSLVANFFGFLEWSFKRSFFIILLGDAIVKAFMIYLGYTFGEHVLSILDILEKYIGYITLAIIVIVIVQGYFSLKKKRKSEIVISEEPNNDSKETNNSEENKK